MNSTTHQAITALDSMRLPELQARYLEVLGTPTRCPNRGFLVHKISEALTVNEGECDVPEGETSEADGQPSIDTPPATEVDADAACETAISSSVEPPSIPSTKRARGRFRGMTIEELQHKYFEIVGRPSSSEDRGYLVWKIREAEKGHVSVGPVSGRRLADAPLEVKVLPLRIETELVERIDRAWHSMGLRSRTEFLRLAIGSFLDVSNVSSSD